MPKYRADTIFSTENGKHVYRKYTDRVIVRYIGVPFTTIILMILAVSSNLLGSPLKI